MKDEFITIACILYLLGFVLAIIDRFYPEVIDVLDFVERIKERIQNRKKGK